MREYWSCGKLADSIRKTIKPYALEFDEWEQWKIEARNKAPVRYWIAEKGLDLVQDTIMYIPRKIYDLKYYVNNRWVTHTHALTAHPRDIKPGQWQDVGNRFLPCLFNELVDFVEVELAWWHIAWDEEARKKFKSPFWASGWFRWRTWRCPEAGLENLEWQRNLRWSANELGKDNPEVGKLTHQAINAQEILDLYKWWTEVYPNRPDPHDASGWSAYCEASRLANGGKLSWMGSDKSPELKKMGDKALKLTTKIEKQYEDEDEKMMIRLIKIRNSLWT